LATGRRLVSFHSEFVPRYPSAAEVRPRTSRRPAQPPRPGAAIAGGNSKRTCRWTVVRRNVAGVEGRAAPRPVDGTSPDYCPCGPPAVETVLVSQLGQVRERPTRPSGPAGPAWPSSAEGPRLSCPFPRGWPVAISMARTPAPSSLDTHPALMDASRTRLASARARFDGLLPLHSRGSRAPRGSPLLSAPSAPWDAASTRATTCLASKPYPGSCNGPALTPITASPAGWK